MTTSPFFHAFLGGLLIGAGAALLLLMNGKVAGISGIVGNSLRGVVGEHGWRLAFLLGLVLPAIVAGIGQPQFTGGLAWLAISGLLVGLGTQIGRGCTSGHGVCGLANFSRRSLVATATFMGVAIVTVFIVRHVLA